MKAPEWEINKKTTINSKNAANKCFQYSITVALNHQNIVNHPERISNIGIFIDQYNWVSSWNKRVEKVLTLFWMGFFGAAHGWLGGGGAFWAPTLKSATHILQ